MDYTKFTPTTFKCTELYCTFVGYTVNQLAEHRIAKHSKEVIPTHTSNGMVAIPGTSPSGKVRIDTRKPE